MPQQPLSCMFTAGHTRLNESVIASGQTKLLEAEVGARRRSGSCAVRRHLPWLVVCACLLPEVSALSQGNNLSLALFSAATA